jgi:hypothetical protein
MPAAAIREKMGDENCVRHVGGRREAVHKIKFAAWHSLSIKMHFALCQPPFCWRMLGEPKIEENS